MLKVTKLSATALTIYIMFYLQVWGDNHVILYGTAVLTVLSLIIYCFQQGKMSTSNVPFGIWNNLIMVAYALISGFFVSGNYPTIVSACVTYAAFSSVCVAICYVSSEEKTFEWVLNVLIVVALLCAVYALFWGTKWEGYGRTLSRTNNPHSFAAVMNLGIFSVAFSRRNSDKSNSLISIVFIALFYFSIIESGSRKYLIASSALVIIWIIAFFKDKWAKNDFQQRVLTAVVGGVIFLIAIYFFRRVYLQSDMYLRMNETNDLGNQNRIWFYREAGKIFLEYPLFGGGLDQFKYLSGTGGYAHSTYAEAIADFGLVGCIMYFSPFIYALSQILKRLFITRLDYTTSMLAALCISELFIGIGQVFFMSFHHFIAWMLIFYYIKQGIVVENYPKPHFKYIRDI